jgi:hypothetical protein
VLPALITWLLLVVEAVEHLMVVVVVQVVIVQVRGYLLPPELPIQLQLVAVALPLEQI